jgi:hypothetical protein
MPTLARHRLQQHYLKPLKERMEDEKTDASAMANFNSLFSDIQVIRNYNGYPLHTRCWPRREPMPLPRLPHTFFVRCSFLLYACACVCVASNLLNDLRPRMQKWSAHQGIGDIFVQMVRCLSSFSLVTIVVLMVVMIPLNPLTYAVSGPRRHNRAPFSRSTRST